MEASTGAYYQSLRGSPAAEYLLTRGITGVSAQSYRLGYVANPLAGHEDYRGMLCIPYLTRAGVVAVRFRRIDPDPNNPGPGPKYQSVPGDRPRIYNAPALTTHENYVCITEGEIDCITATQAGLPAVAIAGVGAWRAPFARVFSGYERVLILADNDPPKFRENCNKCKDADHDECQGHSPGNEFAIKVAEAVDNAHIIRLPVGQDVNSFVQEAGPNALRALLDLD